MEGGGARGYSRHLDELFIQEVFIKHLWCDLLNTAVKQRKRLSGGGVFQATGIACAKALGQHWAQCVGRTAKALVARAE